VHMLTHPTGHFQETIFRPLGGDGPSKFLHALLAHKFFQSDLGRRVASSWVLSHISIFIFVPSDLDLWPLDLKFASLVTLVQRYVSH